MKDSPGVTASDQALRRDPAWKRLPIKSFKEPKLKYGVLVTCFSSCGGFSSSVSSPVAVVPNGVWLGSFPGKSSSCAVGFGRELWGVVKMPDDGVTNVKEWFEGSGDLRRDGSVIEEAPSQSNNTSESDMLCSGETFDDLSSVTRTSDTSLLQRHSSTFFSKNKDNSRMKDWINNRLIQYTLRINCTARKKSAVRKCASNFSFSLARWTRVHASWLFKSK